MKDFTHLDEQGRARMVDVGDKDVTKREATASARVLMQPQTLQKVLDGEIKKGDVFATCRIAGIQAAKKCWDLIPLCHPLALTSVEVNFDSDTANSSIEISATCRVNGKTGVEMEALTAVSVAALTLYDMCKAIDRGMVVEQIGLVKKSGGNSGQWQRPEEA